MKAGIFALLLLFGLSAGAQVGNYAMAVGGTLIIPPALKVVNLTEQILYTEGAKPLYSGCPSAKVMISGGRYDYTFDDHRRLVKADYTASSPHSRTDYSTEYSYDDVANPLTVKRKGVINDTSLGIVYYGVLDDLAYSYKGNQVQHIEQGGTGVDFYGRTGYALESGDYTWNEAGLLNSDSSRGIVSTTYNHLGLPASQVIPSGLTSSIGYQPTKTVNYAYSADGVLLAINSGVIRYYSGNRIFEGNGLLYSYFPGGYFDAAGAVHYTHADYQGSIIAVTDSAGTVVQTTNYYPYGEPWREPTGQPMLFGGKERTTLADYHFDPRNYNAAGIFWHAPDRNATNFTRFSPYSYCCGNPIAYTDPTGDVVQMAGALIGGAVDLSAQLLVSVYGEKKSFTDAWKSVDFVSVGKSMVAGAFCGPLANVSKITNAVSKVSNLSKVLPAIEVGLEVIDATLDLTIDKGLTTVGSEETDKDLGKALLDFGGSVLANMFTKGVVKAARFEVVSGESSTIIQNAIKNQDSEIVGPASFILDPGFEIVVEGYNQCVKGGFINNLTEKRK